MKVAIIGCGFIGQKRAANLSSHELILCVDTIETKAQSLASQFPHCRAMTDWQQALLDPDVDMVIIATLHATLSEIAHAAIRAGKHVLIEKPGARASSELMPLVTLAREKNVLVRIGFNHRYHRALRKARELLNENTLGELMFIRARYGHGGRVGYEKEWRAQPELSGGGELIDQGVHVIDLARWFLGDFVDIQGCAHTYYWDMPVDDNSFLLLTTAKKQTAFIHVSCTEWKNTFAFEIYGRNGKIEINGLGGSYGVERLAFYKMSAEMGPPETVIWEYPMADDSWKVEFNAFADDIMQGRETQPNLQDAIAVLKVVEEIYRKSNL